MKKKLLMFIISICLIIPAVFMLISCSTTNDNNVQVRVQNGYIQWSTNDIDWQNVITIDEILDSIGDDIKGEQGIQGPQGEQGQQGEQGVDGKQVEFNVSSTHIQWRYVGDSTWKNLISIKDLNKEEPSYEGDVCSTVWKNYDGTILYSEINHPLNESPTYKGEQPVRESPYGYPQLKYTFDKWVETKTRIIDNVKVYREYTATFSEFLQTSGEIKVIVDDVEYHYDFDNRYFVVKNFDSTRKIIVIPSEINGVKVGKFDVNSSSNLNVKEVKTILLPESLEVISSIGYVPLLTEIVIPASVKRIEDHAFFNYWNDSSLQKIVFEENSQLKYIGQNAFAGCPIRKITIPERVEEIDQYAFENCVELESLDFVEGSQLERISSVFVGCTSLSSVILPENLVVIGGDAFKDCSNLADVWINSTEDIYVSNSAFEGCDLEYVYTKQNVVVQGLEAYGLNNSGPINQDGLYDLWKKIES